jgi:hypothetical protein
MCLGPGKQPGVHCSTKLIYYIISCAREYAANNHPAAAATAACLHFVSTLLLVFFLFVGKICKGLSTMRRAGS